MLLVKVWSREHGLETLSPGHLGNLPAEGYPTLFLQPEYCRRAQLKIPVSEAPEELALDWSVCAKSQLRPLSSYSCTHPQPASHQRVSEHV